mgnify:CR=1 FL=1|jgi:hypothetical protein
MHRPLGLGLLETRKFQRLLAALGWVRSGVGVLEADGTGVQTLSIKVRSIGSGIVELPGNAKDNTPPSTPHSPFSASATPVEMYRRGGDFLSPLGPPDVDS